ncbi:choline/carnitine O-acyltransferase [Actinomadura luteofluorescens]|uniref:choline/carnitine O-acyltransferase n=1 Tax=Actinomadura luteofluorescens TaxID=46163 RepID=UPI0036402795
MNASQELSSRTFGNEERLPRVPLPTLDATCERFLEWCGPLLTADERARTESALASFARPDGPGRALHAALERYDASEGWRAGWTRSGPTATSAAATGSR